MGPLPWGILNTDEGDFSPRQDDLIGAHPIITLYYFFFFFLSSLPTIVRPSLFPIPILQAKESIPILQDVHPQRYKVSNPNFDPSRSGNSSRTKRSYTNTTKPNQGKSVKTSSYD
eukprot:TRINITY_DN4230_c0_g4_i2.p1 TRINITY_DN4230_c0_g4~~TRINITY_DN4230_c0_g4_i2.p1  ORF type:complete len:115 (+),score=1.36 TRINITY_DN4230_c0_g4_i2:103-447(+)